ncbi:glycosyltransferase 61 family protein [Cytophagaceae bacterium DM2B3-1]|uniref:Glycosyltransferase 61 family protein n=1 Tax=Xanthocytophaga flava TaxID=3048013 RepID=A0ABT7CKK4_9BACT|nr:glycosyltransferase 61 family protein [Xanthocytophaga flavus]MDJ1468323.1 glycosyltransferase 61 family protein [Xanthocytophaga flavus]MDJ1493209.1 glycosyltransferase 61 family protein [Xanthocytophaga flavus]
MKKTVVYESETITRRAPLNYEEISQSEEPFIRLEETLPACYLCELSNALVSPYGIVFKNGRIIQESVYSMFTKNKNALTFYKKLLLGKVKRVSADCVIAHNAYYDNYYHWTTEALPRLFSIREKAPSLTLLLHEKTPRFIDEYLRFFSFREIVRVKDDEIVWAKKLWLPMHTARGLAHRLAVVTQLGNWIRSKEGIAPQKVTKKLFISREKAKYRRAINEAEVFQLFELLGYEKIYLEELTLPEQIQLFTNASKIAGIHGAGFSNLLYSSQATLLTDIIHWEHQQDAFYNLADAMNVDYLRIECKGVGKESYCGTDDIIVDLKQLEKHLTLLT